MRSQRMFVSGLILGLVVSFGSFSTSALAEDSDGPLTITPRADVDERLFLIYALEELYGQMPAPMLAAAERDRALDAIRHKARQHAEYIRQKELGPKLASCFDDLDALCDRYQEASDKILSVDPEGATAIETQEAGRPIKKVGIGLKAAGALFDLAKGGAALWVGDFVEAGASLFGASVTGLDLYVDWYYGNFGEGNQIDEAARRTIDRIVKEYDTAQGRAIDKVRAFAFALGERSNWKPGEAIVRVTIDETDIIAKVIKRKDVRELARILNIDRARRPRNPFALVASTKYAILAEDRITSEDCARAADDCLNAASLVPRGQIYDTYRLAFLARAGEYAVKRITSNDSFRQGWAGAPYPQASQAVRIWRACLELDPVDSSGEARYKLAYALACDGRSNEALGPFFQVKRLHDSDAHYHYNAACLLSITEHTDPAFGWLEGAIGLGFADVEWAKKDPALERLRQKRRDDFNELTAVKFKWRIDWGYFSDDIELTNQSKFAFTKIAAWIVVDSKDYPAWEQPFTATGLAPGKSLRWKTHIKSRGKNTHAKMSLYVNQNGREVVIREESQSQ